jgi:hypothetical protein
MTDVTPDAAAFDLVAAINATTYPEDEVLFLFDEAAANAIAALDAELKKNLALGRAEQYEEVEKVYFDAIENLKPITFKVTVRSVPREVTKAVIAEADAKYPKKFNALTGVEEVSDEKEEFFNVLNWRAHIVKFEDPNGKVVHGPLPKEHIELLLNKGPKASLAAVGAKINELDSGAAAGYEQAVRNLDFLSKPSHEGTPDATLPASE